MQNLTEDAHYSRLDHAIATFLSEHSLKHKGDQKSSDQQGIQPQLKALIRNLSASLSKGHSCIPVSKEQQHWLTESGLATGEGNSPLILEDSRLYFHRYWHYETRLAEQLKYKVKNSPQEAINIETLLDHYFPVENTISENTIFENDSSSEEGNLRNTETNWQRLAAKHVAEQLFSIIIGGPGTGKTTTVLKILALLQELEFTIPQKPLTIALAAPTGKAAMRLQESIGEGLEKEESSTFIPATKQVIPKEVSTIHRLLGAKPASPYFKHHAKNPLIYDLVVIDEASMVDLALMSKLVDALKSNARLILLGDKDQLASVESGAVLNDLSLGLPDHTSELKKSYRFDHQIKDFAAAINQQNHQLAWKILTSDDYPEITLVTSPLLPHIMSSSKGFFDAVKANNTPDDIFQAFKQFQVLCSNRLGKLGVEGINYAIERKLQQQSANLKTLSAWYAGKPVIITRNDPSTQLFNGDIGICLKEESDLYVYFQLANGDIKKLLPSRLPQHETAYALTIHKSQGSEFEHVLMVLPEKPNPVLGKELVYTAVTRAKKKIGVASNQQVFDYALNRQVERHSGLKEKISST